MSQRDQLKVSTRVMYDEFCRQDTPVRIIDATSSLIEFTDRGGQNHLLFSTLGDKSSAVGLMIANNKMRTELLAKRLNIDVPLDTLCHTFEDALEFFATHHRVVLKPLNNSGGNGVSTHITSLSALRAGYAYARKFSDDVIIQQHVEGSDLRLLVVAGVFCSAVERRPAHVTGDGTSPIRQLIEQENLLPTRSDNYMTALSQINIDSAKRFLGKAFSSISQKDVGVQVVGPANLSLGGTAHEATGLVNQVMIAEAELIASRLGLGICGVDMIWNQDTGKHYLIEVNATPGIDLHNDPFWKTSSDAAKRYVEWLIDPNQQMTRD